MSEFLSKSRSGAIREALHDAIVDRRLLPGTKLVEDEVGATFSASRTVVRAALQALAHDGVVTIEQNRGAFVSRPTPDEARHVFTARRMIEPGLAAAAAARITPEAILELEQQLAVEAEAIASRGPHARRAEIHASGQFHLTIARIAGNPLLAKFLGELVARSSLVIALYGRTGASSCARDEHSRIVDMLRSGNAVAAADLMLHHIAHIEADVDFRETQAAAGISALLKG